MLFCHGHKEREKKLLTGGGITASKHKGQYIFLLLYCAANISIYIFIMYILIKIYLNEITKTISGDNEIQATLPRAVTPRLKNTVLAEDSEFDQSVRN